MSFTLQATRSMDWRRSQTKGRPSLSTTMVPFPLTIITSWQTWSSRRDGRVTLWLITCSSKFQVHVWFEIHTLLYFVNYYRMSSHCLHLRRIQIVIVNSELNPDKYCIWNLNIHLYIYEYICILMLLYELYVQFLFWIISCFVLFFSGFKLLLEVFSVIHGPQEECVRALRNGHLLGISPGGVREALFSDETYPLFWGKRRGFAQVAIDSQVVGHL